MKHNRRAALAALTAALLGLGGCAASVPKREGATVTLPPAKAVFQAPQGDEQRTGVESVLMYLPDTATGQPAPVAVTMALPPGRHPGEAVLTRLFSFSGSDKALPLPAASPLSLSGPVEISGETATVNLGASALALDSHEKTTVCRAIVNTLCQWGDIRYVNLLFAGRQPGTDLAGSLPMGALRFTANEEALWPTPKDDERFSAVATLYYPASLGKGVLAESRAVTMPGKQMKDMALALLGALSAPSLSHESLPQTPALEQLLAGGIAVSEQAGGKVVSLRFKEEANAAFVNAGIPRSVMMASITLTLTTFLPGVSGVSVEIGDEKITALTPGAILDGAGREIHFENGVMKRADFSAFLLDNVSLCFKSGDALTAVERALPWRRARNLRAVLEALFSGPDDAEKAAGLSSALPENIRASDLLGYTKEGDTVLINLSEQFLSSAASFSPSEERLMIYAVVNTLCIGQNARHVRFFVASKQPESFSGALYLPGEFLFNPGVMK